jgi:hypothetical protein
LLAGLGLGFALRLGVLAARLGVAFAFARAGFCLAFAPAALELLGFALVGFVDLGFVDLGFVDLGFVDLGFVVFFAAVLSLRAAVFDLRAVLALRAAGAALADVLPLFEVFAMILIQPVRRFDPRGVLATALPTCQRLPTVASPLA